MPYRVVLTCHTFDTTDTNVRNITKRVTCKICKQLSPKIKVEHIDTVRLLE